MYRVIASLLPARKPLLITSFSLLALVSLALTVIMTLQVVLHLDDLRGSHKINIEYTLAQIEVDQAKLAKAVSDARLDPDALHFSNLRQRFDNFYSRIEIIHDSPFYSEILADSAAEKHAKTIWTVLPEIAAIVDQPDAELQTNLDLLDRKVGLLTQEARLMSAASVMLQSELTDHELRGLNNMLLRLAVVSVMMMIGFISVLVLLWQLYRNLKVRAALNRATMQRLSTIIETSKDAILVVARDGLITDTNGAANAIFEFDKAGPSPLFIDNLLSYETEGGDISPLHAKHLFARSTDIPGDSEASFGQSLGGKTFPVEMTTSKVTQMGRVVCVCFIRDVSERRQAESRIKDAQQKTVEAERAKARFLGMISHEMRTPLNGILGALDLVSETRLSKKQTEYIKIMQSSGQVLLGQINDALEATREQAPTLELSPSVFDLDALLNELIDGLHPAASVTGNDISRTDDSDSLGFVIGDKGRLRQVLLNLLSNAVKFTRSGRITIDARRDQSVGTDMITFEISDTGVGMSEDQLAEVFDDYVRFSQPGHGNVEGTGLGLGIARRLTTLLGGEIGARSQPGAGSTFWVRVPLTAADGPISGPPALNRQESPPQSILVVEDNPTNRFVLSEMLRKDGHSVTEAKNGLEGVNCARSTAFDLILMDVSMPIMNGLEATAQIRATKGPSRHCPIIALTAHYKAELEPKYTEAGFDRVETKPLRLSVLREILADAPAAQQAPAQTGLVDQETLKQLQSALSTDKVATLLDRFADEGDQFFGRADMFWEADARTQMHEVHQFAGSAATFGALALRESLIGIEALIEDGKQDRAKDEWSNLAQQWPQHKDALRAALNAT